MENKIISRSPISFDDKYKNHKSIYFEVPGNPFAKQRPRAARRGIIVTIYTPIQTKQYENKVKSYYNRSYRGIKLDGDLTVEIEGIFEVPKSISKKKKQEMISGIIPHTSKPDCDNMGKICLDALNGIAYNDDANINKLVISKRYGENPMMRIMIIENKENKS